jgi:hypothetical protein
MLRRAARSLLLLPVVAAPARASHDASVGYAADCGGSAGSVDSWVFVDPYSSILEDSHVDDPLVSLAPIDLRSQPITLSGSGTSSRSGHFDNPYGTSSDTIPFIADASVTAGMQIAAGSISGEIEVAGSASPSSFTAVGGIEDPPILFTNPYEGAASALLCGCLGDLVSFHVPALATGDPIQVEVVLEHQVSLTSLAGAGASTAFSKAEFWLSSVHHAGSHVAYDDLGISAFLREGKHNGTSTFDDPNSVGFLLDLANGDSVVVDLCASMDAVAAGNDEENFRNAAVTSAAGFRFVSLTPGVLVGSALGATYPVPEPPGGAVAAALALAGLARRRAMGGRRGSGRACGGGRPAGRAGLGGRGCGRASALALSALLLAAPEARAGVGCDWVYTVPGWRAALSWDWQHHAQWGEEMSSQYTGTVSDVGSGRSLLPGLDFLDETSNFLAGTLAFDDHVIEDPPEGDDRFVHSMLSGALGPASAVSLYVDTEACQYAWVSTV